MNRCKLAIIASLFARILACREPVEALIKHSSVTSHGAQRHGAPGARSGFHTDVDDAEAGLGDKLRNAADDDDMKVDTVAMFNKVRNCSVAEPLARRRAGKARAPGQLSGRSKPVQLHSWHAYGNDRQAASLAQLSGAGALRKVWHAGARQPMAARQRRRRVAVHSVLRRHVQPSPRLPRAVRWLHGVQARSAGAAAAVVVGHSAGDPQGSSCASVALVGSGAAALNA